MNKYQKFLRRVLAIILLVTVTPSYVFAEQANITQNNPNNTGPAYSPQKATTAQNTASGAVASKNMVMGLSATPQAAATGSAGGATTGTPQNIVVNTPQTPMGNQPRVVERSYVDATSGATITEKKFYNADGTLERTEESSANTTVSGPDNANFTTTTRDTYMLTTKASTGEKSGLRTLTETIDKPLSYLPDLGPIIYPDLMQNIHSTSTLAFTWKDPNGWVPQSKKVDKSVFKSSTDVATGIQLYSYASRENYEYVIINGVVTDKKKGTKTKEESLNIGGTLSVNVIGVQEIYNGQDSPSQIISTQYTEAILGDVITKVSSMFTESFTFNANGVIIPELTADIEHKTETKAIVNAEPDHAFYKKDTHKELKGGLPIKSWEDEVQYQDDYIHVEYRKISATSYDALGGVTETISVTFTMDDSGNLESIEATDGPFGPALFEWYADSGYATGDYDDYQGIINHINTVTGYAFYFPSLAMYDSMEQMRNNMRQHGP